MGGGEREPSSAAEEHQELVVHMYQVCDIASYACSDSSSPFVCSEYEQVARVIHQLECSPYVNPVVANCAMYADTIQQLKKAAKRYCSVEASTRELAEKAQVLASGLKQVAEGGRLLAALHVNALGLRTALEFMARKMSALGTTVEGIAAVHRAVGRDVDCMMASTASVVDNPTRADIGLKAAPLIGGTAASTIGLLLMRAGPMGLLGAAALFGVGAIGASEVTQAKVLPLVKDSFKRLYYNASCVSSLIDSRATGLEMLAVSLAANAAILTSMLEVKPDGSELSFELYEEKNKTLRTCVDVLLNRCEAARSRTSAFLSMSIGHEK